jgi:hypothetical protein
VEFGIKNIFKYNYSRNPYNYLIYNKKIKKLFNGDLNGN